MLGPPVTRLSLEVALPPPRARERLRSTMQEVRSFLFSPAWGGERPFVGAVDGERFRLRVRHGYSNGLTRLLYGRIVPAGSGSRIECEFRTLGFVVGVLRAAWIAILVLAGPHLLEVTRQARAEGAVAWPQLALSLLVPLGMLALLIGIEALARRMGRHDEKRMRRHLASLYEDVTAEL